MAIRFVPESNLAGAPGSPLPADPALRAAVLKRNAPPLRAEAAVGGMVEDLVARGMHRDEAVRIALEQTGYAETVQQRLRDEWENRPTAATPETQPPAQPNDMAQFDVLPGDQPGTQRVWNPRTGSYETRRMPQADPRAAEKAVEQQRTYDNIAENYAPGEADKWRSADERGTIHVPRTPRMIDRADAARQDEYLAMEGGIGARGRIQQRTEGQSQTYHPQWAREAGLDPNDPEVMAMPRGDLIAAARAKRNEGKPTPQQRENMWRVQMMMNAGNFAGAMTLAGSDPNMASVIMNQQNAALNANRGGGPIQFGPNPLGVQAAGQAQLAEAGRQGALGRGLQQPPQGLVDQQRQALADKARQDNPEAAGARDLAAGDLTTPEARQVLEKMAEQYDTGGDFFGTEAEGTSVWYLPGVGAMSHADEERLRIAIRDRFSVSDEEAAHLAREAANSRRRGPWGGNWGMRPGLPRPKSGAAPQAPTTATPKPPQPAAPAPDEWPPTWHGRPPSNPTGGAI